MGEGNPAIMGPKGIDWRADVSGASRGSWWCGHVKHVHRTSTANMNNKGAFAASALQMVA